MPVERSQRNFVVKRDIDQVLMQKLINEQKLYNEEIKHAIKIRANKEVTYVEG